ncbi:MAG: polyprenyl synthetase family protein, partial [Gammaproteobacteria bacterium]
MLQEHLAPLQARIDAALERFLPSADSAPQRLHAAMRYAVLAPGKRIRPVLTHATGAALGADPALLDAPATAVELIHAYSLIHDDLPALAVKKHDDGRIWVGTPYGMHLIRDG